LFLVVDVGVCVVATFDPVDTAVAIDPSDRVCFLIHQKNIKSKIFLD
jgi:hypothetical protein